MENVSKFSEIANRLGAQFKLDLEDNLASILQAKDE